MPARSPFTATMTLAGGFVVATAGAVVVGAGTLVGALGSATEPIHGNGPSDACGSRSTSAASALSPLPAATRMPPISSPDRAITTAITMILRLSRPPDDAGAAAYGGGDGGGGGGPGGVGGGPAAPGGPA